MTTPPGSPPAPGPLPRGPAEPAAASRAGEYLLATLIVSLTTALALVARDLLHVPDVEMLFLLAVMIVALASGRRASILAAALSVLAYDFFIVPPPYTLDVADARYLLTFAMMLALGIVIVTLCYVALNAVYFYVLSVDRVMASTRVAADADRDRLDQPQGPDHLPREQVRAGAVHGPQDLVAEGMGHAAEFPARTGVAFGRHLRAARDVVETALDGEFSPFRAVAALEKDVRAERPPGVEGELSRPDPAPGGGCLDRLELEQAAQGQVEVQHLLQFPDHCRVLLARHGDGGGDG